MSELRFTVGAAQNAKEALRLIQEVAAPVSAAHGHVLHDLVAANDASDKQRVELCRQSAAKLIEAMGKLAAVEMFLYNETLPKCVEAPKRG
jgi:hypothetical protein